jgi:hypothetical protein
LRRIAGLIVAFVALAAIAVIGGTTAEAAPVLQPGTSITDGTNWCTLNWIYDGTGSQAGHVFGGAAAHCFATGKRVSISSASLQPPIAQFGTVAYRSSALDFELIRIDTPCACAVSAAMAGHPKIPSGVATTANAKVGDLVQYSGHGTLTDFATLAQQQRVGVLGYNDGTQHFSYGVVSPGDSGGPVGDITDGNKALGIVDTVGFAVTLPLPQAGEGGVSMQGLLADAATHGFPVRVRTV